MTPDQLEQTLAKHGLVKATDLDKNQFDAIQDGRPTPVIPLKWEQLTNITTNNPWATPYLYVNTGFDPLVILNPGTGEYINPQILLFDSPAFAKQHDVVRDHIQKWENADTLDAMLDHGDTDRFVMTLDRSIILAPNFIKELVYFLAPWVKADRHGLTAYHRATALRVRKTEEYPSETFDEMIIDLLYATQPSDYGDPPEEEVLTEPVTIYRGEIDKSHHLALSWTRRREIAEGFATRFGKHGVVYEATIPPERILAAYASDTEREVLVDDLTGITIKEHRM